MTDVTAPPTERQVPTAVVAGLVAVVVLMVAGGIWWWLAPGSDQATDASDLAVAAEPADPGLAATTPEETAPPPGPDELGLGEDPAAPLETFQVVLSRDPFRSVRPETTETASATAADGSAVVTTDPAGTTTDGATPVAGAGDPTAVPAPVGGSGEDGEACRTEGALVCDGSVVSVVEILDPPGAVVEVDAVRYAVMVDESFAENYRLLGVDGDCGLISYGDETFRQCVGAAALLK